MCTKDEACNAKPTIRKIVAGAPPGFSNFNSKRSNSRVPSLLPLWKYFQKARDHEALERQTEQAGSWLSKLRKTSRPVLDLDKQPSKIAPRQEGHVHNTASRRKKTEDKVLKTEGKWERSRKSKTLLCASLSDSFLLIPSVFYALSLSSSSSSFFFFLFCVPVFSRLSSLSCSVFVFFITIFVVVAGRFWRRRQQHSKQEKENRRQSIEDRR